PGAVNAPATAKYAVLALASRNSRHRNGHQIAGVVTGNAAPLRVLERVEGERPGGVILDPTFIRAKPARVVSPRTTIDVWLAASETCRIGGPNLRLFALLAIFQNSFRKDAGFHRARASSRAYNLASARRISAVLVISSRSAQRLSSSTKLVGTRKLMIECMPVSWF